MGLLRKRLKTKPEIHNYASFAETANDEARSLMKNPMVCYRVPGNNFLRIHNSTSKVEEIESVAIALKELNPTWEVVIFTEVKTVEPVLAPRYFEYTTQPPRYTLFQLLSKSERRERRKKNRRFPVHGKSLQHILAAIRKRGKRGKRGNENC